jgi:hypothetical protein
MTLVTFSIRFFFYTFRYISWDRDPVFQGILTWIW